MNTPQGVVTYRYDDAGNRIERTINGVTERYVRDHTGAEVALSNSTDGYKYFTLRGIGSFGRVDVDSRTVMYEDPETNDQYEVKVRVDNRRYYVQDHLGSIKATVDDAGEIVGYDDMDAYGNVLDGRSMNNANPNDLYKFTGKERDKETDYDYFGFRQYDAKLARWLSVDPFEDMYAGLSPYNYCANNPVSIIDPDGGKITAAYDLSLSENIMAASAGLRGDPFAELENALRIQAANLVGDIEDINHGIRAYYEKLNQANEHEGANTSAPESAGNSSDVNSGSGTEDSNNSGTNSQCDEENSCGNDPDNTSDGVAASDVTPAPDPGEEKKSERQQRIDNDYNTAKRSSVYQKYIKLARPVVIAFLIYNNVIYWTIQGDIADHALSSLRPIPGPIANGVSGFVTGYNLFDRYIPYWGALYTEHLRSFNFKLPKSH